MTTTLPETSPASPLVCTAGSSASGTRCAMSTRTSPLSISAVSCESCWASLRTKTPTARTSRASSLGVGIVGRVDDASGHDQATSVSSSWERSARGWAARRPVRPASATAVVVWSMTSSAPAEETRSRLGAGGGDHVPRPAWPAASRSADGAARAVDEHAPPGLELRVVEGACRAVRPTIGNAAASANGMPWAPAPGRRPG